MRALIDRSAMFVVSEAVHTDLGVTRFASEWRRRFATEPSFLFTNIVDYPDHRIVMNLFARDIVVAALGLPPTRYVAEAAARLDVPGLVTEAASHATETLRGVLDLPVLRHQPRDIGKYLTSFVSCLVDPETGTRNLGFYRVLIRDPHHGVIFIDPRTDGYRICRRAWDAGEESVPITLFAGGPSAVYLAGAAAVPPAQDSYEFAARFSGAEICIDKADYPPAPVDAEVVIHGRVTRALADEAPFGEFKGYYCKPTRSPVLEIDRVSCRVDPYYLALFCGKESGLELMSLPNEVLLYRQLRSEGFEVTDVRYPLTAFGEFATLVEVAPAHAHGALEAALRHDRRTKLVVASPRIDALASDLSVFDFDAFALPYIKRSEDHGNRIGIVVRDGAPIDWVEL
jgi:4-hydroxy-3-polyprenylbenzoate decarboxylase